MCLSKVTKKVEPTAEVIAVWKSFRRGWSGDCLSFTNRSIKGNAIVPRGKWVKAVGIRSIGTIRGFYKPGFHCFKTKKGAEDWGYNQVKVLVKRIRTHGIQLDHKVVVADYMYVPTPKQKIVGNKIVKVKG